jgi:hypothetical protein
MSVPAVVWLTIGLCTLVIMLALVLGLIRQVKAVAGALADLRREETPVLQQMREDAERAREHAERLRETEISLPQRSRR